MEEYQGIIVFLIIAFCVLQIILFFKIWGMTDDVKKIKKQTLNEITLDNVRKAIIKNDKELVEKMMIDILVNDLFAFKNGETDKFGSIDQIFSIHKPRFEKLKIDIPENILQIKNSSDINNILV